MDTAILTAEEAARILKVDAEAIVELLNSGDLPGRLVAGKWRTTARALASYIDGVPLTGGMCCGPDGQMACCAPATAQS